MYKNLRGLKFPDSAMIPFFFKSGLHNLTNQKVLELACSNGNNLSLFASYENECIGVDINPQKIEDAKYNFANIFGYKKYSFFASDMFDFIPKNSGIIFEEEKPRDGKKFWAYILYCTEPENAFS